MVNYLDKLKKPEERFTKTSVFIVGLACLIIFFLDVMASALPLALSSVEWRLALLEEITNRAILLIIGSALLLYSAYGNRSFMKKLAVASLLSGIFFHLLCLFTILDTLEVKNQATEAVDNRATQLKIQLEDEQNSSVGESALSSKEIEQALFQISNQSESLKRDLNVDIVKVGVLHILKLVVMGLALIFMGRLGLQSIRVFGPFR